MALSEEIQIAVARLADEEKQNEIVKYLQPKLQHNEISPQDVYQYAIDVYWKKKPSWDETPGTSYVIDANTINDLGLVVGNIEGIDNKLLAWRFYLLAAQRGSAGGCRNYGLYILYGVYGIQKSNEIALQWAEEAIKLTQNTSKPHKHKYFYAQALEANNRPFPAFTALTAYLKFILGKQEINIKNAVDFCEKLIDDFLTNFKKENFDFELAKEHFPAALQDLQSIILYPSTELLRIQNKACFLAGKYNEFLKKDSNAWIKYCQAKAKEMPFYVEVVSARKELLKNFIKKQFDGLIISTIPIGDLKLDEASSSKPQLPKKPADTLLLPDETPISFNGSNLWKKDSHFVHSVNESELEIKRREHLKPITAMIESKHEELVLILKDIDAKRGNPKELEAEKIRLNAELNQLSEITEQYLPYTADYRKTFRRYQTEICFFDPKRLKKQEVLEKLRDLTLRIVDQRFSLANVTTTPVDLSGISSRMLITAERVFQEAVIALSGKSGVVLGIPRNRGKPWKYGNGTNWFGAVERYQVAKTEIQAEHRTSPKRQRLGDSYMPQHGSYTPSIYPFLRNFANWNIENEKIIAQYLIRYCKTHQSITLDELKNFYPAADETHVNTFNQIAFLIMEKEQAQWHSATEKKYQLGMSVAQARALMMLEAGFLTFEEVFKNDVLFGVYSQTGIINSPQKVADACKNIEELYTSFILIQCQNDAMRFFKSQITAQEKRSFVLTRKQAHADLKYVYGGDTDSDGEGYDSDLEF